MRVAVAVPNSLSTLKRRPPPFASPGSSSPKHHGSSSGSIDRSTNYRFPVIGLSRVVVWILAFPVAAPVQCSLSADPRCKCFGLLSSCAVLNSHAQSRLHIFENLTFL